MAEVIAIGIPSTGETEKARPSSENVSPLLDNFSPPSANVNPPPKTVTPPKNGIPPSENASIPTGNVYLQPENCDPLAENTSPPIGNGSSPTGNKSLPNNHLDELEVNNKPDGAQIDPQAAEEESSKASGGSISNIHHGSIVPSNLNEKGNTVRTVESPKDCRTPVSHSSEDDYGPKLSNSAMSNPSKKGRSDNVISRSAVSTGRHVNSHYGDGSLPSYALPTVAFQIRISLTTDNVSQDDIPTCNRYKLPSSMCHRHKRRRSQSLDNGLQLDIGSKTDRCISAQPWKAGTARPKGRTPPHGFPAGQKSTRETESRPSSARTDPSARGPSVKSLFTKEKSTSDSNSFQLLKKNVVPAKPSQLSSSVNESEVTTTCVKNTTAKTTDRPKSVTSKESPVSDDFSLKSKKPAWKQTVKASPDKEFSSAHESGLKPRTTEKVVPPVGSSTPTRDDKEKGKEVLSTSREPALKPAPEKVTSPTKAAHDKAPVRAPKPAEDRNISAGKQQGLKPALDTSVNKGPGTKAKQVTPAKTPSSETATSSKDLSPTKVHHAKSSPTKDVLALTEARKDLSTPSRVHSKAQETKSSHNKDVSVKKEPKKAPTPSREEASFGSLAVNKEVKPAASEGESNQQRQPIKSPATGKEKTKEVVAEKTSATAESPAALQKEKESPMGEYKAKLSENRKLAREKAEREAEEERMKDEQARLAEEERKRQEEEEEQRRDEEEMRLAEELRTLEEERYRRSVEETELRKREESERIEAEAKAKAEQEALAKQEAEKLEVLRQEKMKREEEEKQGRKKRLEEIMKRVKADESVTKVEARNTTEHHPPSDITLNQSMERSSLDSSLQHDTVSPVSLSDDSTTHFKSPLLQQLLTGRAKTQTVVVGNFLDTDKKSTNSEAPETMSCLYEEQKTAEEPSRIILSQEMAS